jgi:hypothetical protein
VQYAYANTDPGSPLRQLLVQPFAKFAEVHWFPDHRNPDDEYPARFTKDLVEVLLNERTLESDWDLEKIRMELCTDEGHWKEKEESRVTNAKQDQDVLTNY